MSATSGAAALLAAGIANAAIPGASRVDCAIALTALVGVFFVLGAALRITALTSFISRAALHGFGFGLAVTIAVRQLPALLGLAPTGGSLWNTIGSVMAGIGEIKVPSLLVGTLVLLLLGLSRRLRFAAAGLVVVIASIVAMRIGPANHFGIAVAGPLALQAPTPHLPALTPKDWMRLAQFAVPIAIVILAESWATIRTLAVARGDPISAEREIVALGLANMATAVLRGLPVGAGCDRDFCAEPCAFAKTNSVALSTGPRSMGRDYRRRWSSASWHHQRAATCRRTVSPWPAPASCLSKP